MGVAVPDAGEVRFMVITDKQFGRIQVYVGKKRQPGAKTPSQLELF
jgi:CRISPR-associated protein Cas2